MKIKTIIFAILIAGATVSTGAASGQKEAEYEGYPWKTIKVTGKVTFEDWPHPEITSKGTTYELLVPPFYAQEVDVESGQTVTIEGVLVEKGLHGDNKEYLRVTKAVINGKEYVLPLGPRMDHRQAMRGGNRRPPMPKGEGPW